MKTIIACALAACAAAIGACAVRAQNPTPDKNLPATGKVLLLKNQRILEGDIERDGPRYRIRRRIGESSVEITQVAAVCETREQVYQYLRSLANLRDPDERLRLARWCQFQGMLDQGLVEAKAALEMAPKNAEAQRLVKSFERTLCQPGPAAPSGDESPAPQPKHEEEPEVVLSVPLNLQCLTQFNNRVQPILMNACATCHASGRGGHFQLRQTFGQGGLHGKSTRSNLAAAVQFIDFSQAQLSPLLVKAVGVHGGIERPPLEGKQVAAFQVLEEWVRMVVETSPRPNTPKLDPTPIARAPESEPIFASVARPATAQASVPAPPQPEPPPPTQLPPVAINEPAKLQPEPVPTLREIHTIGAGNTVTAPVEIKPPVVEAKPPAPPTTVVAAKPSVTPPTTDDTLHSSFAVAAPAAPPTEAKPPQPIDVPPASADDPFDPVIFNRQMHGGPQ